jgi:hypothetical protein
MTFSNSQYRFSETPENKPHTQGEGPQMSEKTIKEKGDEITQPKKKSSNSLPTSL